jgi:sulfite oxidase
MSLSRRTLLRSGAFSVVAGTLGCAVFGGAGGDKDLLTRRKEPYNGEPPLPVLDDDWTTPFNRFFVRSHGAIPDVQPGPYLLTIEGHVERVQQFSLEDLERFKKTAAPVTIQCAENRSGELARMKRIEGIPWDAGAIGTAEWRGVRLADLLKRAGVKAGARHVWFDGLDAVTLPDRQTVYGSELPLERAMRPENLVALEMNGAPLSRDHGYPARLVAAGCVGARSVKWLGRIVVAEKRSENVFAAREYREAEPILDHPLNSAICRPRPGEIVKEGKLAVRGYAVPPGVPGAAIAGVEVSPDGGATWVAARLTEKEAPFAWRLWTAEVEVASGARTLIARATDSAGGKQPERPAWNPKGYLCSGWHQVPVTVV